MEDLLEQDNTPLYREVVGLIIEDIEELYVRFCKIAGIDIPFPEDLWDNTGECNIAEVEPEHCTLEDIVDQYTSHDVVEPALIIGYMMAEGELPAVFENVFYRVKY